RIRPKTYEDAAEVLSYVFAGPQGLESTSFALLDPDGEKFTRESRSPSVTYGSTEEFQGASKRISTRYEPKARPAAGPPTLRDRRLSLNVAAADMRALMVLRADKPADRTRQTAAVAELASTAERVGRLHLALLGSEETFEDPAPGEGIAVVQPDPYGLGGDVLAERGLAATLAAGVKAFEAAKGDRDAHTRKAREGGIHWETAIPMTHSHWPRRRAEEGRRRDGPLLRRDRWAPARVWVTAGRRWARPCPACSGPGR
ncbi:MAG: hypothetical protein ACPGPE_16905, partial [Planctomycetota bacterium]